MPNLELPNVPEGIYKQMEKLAIVRGTSVAAVAVDFLTKAMSGEDEAEQKLLAEIRADREAMAKRGVWITPEGIQEAKNWGRK